jgi:para-aminobenzoate synthetase component I
MMSAIEQATFEMNKMGREGTPFLFIIDFLMENPIVVPFHFVDPEKILFSVNGMTNLASRLTDATPAHQFNIELPDKESYLQRFNKVMQHLNHGDSYLLNLTMPVGIACNLGLKQIFERSKARYKLWVKDQFTVFSPEPFVRIVNGKIFSYPMKGTIDASLPDAMNKLLHDEKEIAEHYTIVDLIRNDLNMVAQQVRVDKFRYVEELNTSKGKLLQTSSLISGRLPATYHENIGELLVKLLPAGSISGAPKKKTLEIIRETEQYERGYYTGVFGYFRDNNLDCGVMIRYIEQQGEQLVFKAGGGITVNSNADEEYRELVSKVYLPL